MRFLGKLLTVNLTTRRIEREELPQAATQQLLFGRGINAWLMANHVDRDIDLIAPEIVLAFSCGLLTGTQPPASSCWPVYGNVRGHSTTRHSASSEETATAAHLMHPLLFFIALLPYSMHDWTYTVSGPAWPVFPPWARHPTELDYWNVSE